MTIATGTRSQIGYVAEVTYGVTPATPALIELPITQASLNLTREEYEDNSIRPDGMERYSISGNKSVGGSLDVQFAHAQFDDMLSSLLQAPWATNVLKPTATIVPLSFTMEEAHYDIGQFVTYTGMVVDKFDLTVPASGIVTGKIDLIGKTATALATSSVDTVGGYTPAPAKIPFTDNGSAGFIKEGGTTIGYVTSYSLSIDKGLTRNWAVATDTVYELTTGKYKVTGTINVYFKDAVMYNKFINGTASSLDLKLDDGVNTYQFFLPNIKYTGATKTINGTGPVTLSMPFRALYDNTSLSNIVITRS